MAQTPMGRQSRQTAGHVMIGRARTGAIPAGLGLTTRPFTTERMVVCDRGTCSGKPRCGIRPVRRDVNSPAT